MKQWVSCHLARLALSSLKSKGPAFSCGPALAESGLGPIKFGVRSPGPSFLLQMSPRRMASRFHFRHLHRRRKTHVQPMMDATPCNTMQHHATPCNTMQHHATLTIIAFGGLLRRSKHQNAGHKNRRGGDFSPQAYENSSLAEKLLALLRVHPARFLEMLRMFFCMLWILFWIHIFISRHQRFHCWVRSFSQHEALWLIPLGSIGLNVWLHLTLLLNIEPCAWNNHIYYILYYIILYYIILYYIII